MVGTLRPEQGLEVRGESECWTLEGKLGTAAWAWVPKVISDPPTFILSSAPLMRVGTDPASPAFIPKEVGVQMGACELRFLSLGRGRCV